MKLLKRIALATLFALGAAASLVTFPQGVPWLALAWVVASAGTRLALPALLAVLAVKRVEVSPATVALAVALVAGIVLEAKKPKARLPRFALLGAACVGLLVETHATVHTSRRVPFDPARPIVCVGDSLSAEGWPRELAKIVRVPVIDLATPGVSAKVSQKHLPKIKEARPQLVIVELGGHDFLHGDARSETKERLLSFVDAVPDAQVVLFEIPRGFVTDGYRGLEREIARERDLELIPDGAIRWLVLFSKDGLLEPFGPRLSEDGLHPDERGHVFLRDQVASVLERLYGPAVFK